MRKRATGQLITALLISLLVASEAAAQDDYTLAVSSDSETIVGQPTTLVVSLDTADDAQGWQFGVCHDPEFLAAEAALDGDALDGVPTTFTGYWIRDEGVICSGLLDVVLGTTLPAGVHEITEIDYAVIGLTDGTDVEICATLGSPLIVPVILVDDEEQIPATESGTVISNIGMETFVFSISSAFVGYPAGTGEADFTLGVTIEEHADSIDRPNDTYGFQLGILHDPAVLVVDDVVPGPVLEDLNDGDGPAFLSFSDEGVGVTVDVLYDLGGTETLQFEDAVEVLLIDYSTIPDELINELEPVLVSLTFGREIGDVSTTNTVTYTIDGDLAPALANEGLITLYPGGPFFARGDCQSNGLHDIADAIAILAYLYQNAETPSCADACDVDDDGSIGLLDAFNLLYHQFGEGTPPEAPYPACGGDGTDDTIGCEDDSACS